MNFIFFCQIKGAENNKNLNKLTYYKNIIILIILILSYHKSFAIIIKKYFNMEAIN